MSKPETLAARISRSADIEQHLFNIANGKAPLPSKQDCRVMALRLGTPKAEWSDAVRDHKWEGQAELDALLAQVQLLSTSLQFMVGNIGQPNCIETKEGFDSAKAALAATPQHHLRQVRADAGRDGWLACWNWIGSDIDINFTKANFNDFADQYADSIRQEKK